MDYDGIVFRQTGGSPVQVAFVTPTSELDSWARVPTRLASQPQGFQRAELRGHVEEIERFFKSDTTENSSPTSILVGLDPDLRKDVEILTSNGDPFDLSKVTTAPTRCVVRISFKPWDSSRFTDTNDEIAELLDAVVPWLEQRAGDDVAESGDPVASRESEEVAEAAFEAEVEVAAEEVPDDDEDAEEADEGLQEQVELAGQTSDVSVVSEEDVRELEFLATLTVDKLRQLREDESYKTWARPSQRDWLVRALKDELKPGLIIDGQHRVRGTRDLDDIPFLIDFLPDASWPELAFQFIVNNSSSKRVQNNLLMAIVGQSLNGEQLRTIEARLLRAGIKVALIQASMRLQLESNPFQGMLSTGTPGESGYLDATAMQRKVVEIWFGRRDRSGLRPRLLAIRHPYDSEAKSFKILDLFGANCGKGNAQARSELWQHGSATTPGLWFDYFSAFWRAIQKRYTPRLWPATQDDWPAAAHGGRPTGDERLKLMRATMLGLLQHCVLYRWAANRQIYLDHAKQKLRRTPITIEDFQGEIFEILAPLTDDFFLEHKATGLDASDTTRDEFRRQCYAVLSKDKKVSEVKQTSQWKLTP